MHFRMTDRSVKRERFLRCSEVKVMKRKIEIIGVHELLHSGQKSDERMRAAKFP